MKKVVFHRKKKEKKPNKQVFSIHPVDYKIVYFYSNNKTRRPYFYGKNSFGHTSWLLIQLRAV